METRQLGGSGLMAPVLSLGTATFGGGNEFFKAWGSTAVAGATRLVDLCLDAGLQMFDSSDIYSGGLKKLDEASAKTPVYPYWHQQGFSERNPPPV